MIRRLKKCTALLLAVLLILQTAGLAVMAQEEKGKQEDQTAAERMQETGEEISERETSLSLTEKTQAQTGTPQTETQAPTETQAQTETQLQTETQTDSGQTETENQTGTETTTETGTQTESEVQTGETQTSQKPSEEEQPLETGTEESQEEETSSETGTEEPQEEETSSEMGTEEPQEEETSPETKKGEKLTASGLSSGLKAVLPYLAAAQELTVPEELGEELFLQGEAALGAIRGLKEFSKKIASGRSSSSVEVICLYADQNGTLDLAPLKEAHNDGILDASDRYVVINIIAADPKQDLSLSGFSVNYQGQAVSYEDSARAGYVLYNVTALKDGKTADYTGALTWDGSKGKIGTILAPCASVSVSGGLDGAVYAKSAVLSGSGEEYQRIIFIEGEDGVQLPEAESEEETPVSETEDITEGTENSETATELEEMESSAPMETSDESETFQETGSLLSETSSKEEILNLISENVLEQRWYSQGGLSLQLELVDGENPSQKLTGSISLKAGEFILDQNGTVVYAADQEIASYTWSQAEAYSLGEQLKYSGTYYIELIQTPEGYLPPVRVYLTVDEDGKVSEKSEGGLWNEERTLLQIPLYRDAAAVSMAKVTLKGKDAQGNETDLGGTFVIKDAQGAVLRDQAGNPRYYIECKNGQAGTAAGLAAGEYYLSQISVQEEGYQPSADVKFTIEEGKTTEVTVVNEKLDAEVNTLKVTMRVRYGEQELAAERENRFYAALFLDEGFTQKAGDVKELILKPDGDGTEGEAVFSLNSSDQDQTFYLAQTDAFGTPLTDQETFDWAFQNEAGETVNSVAFPGGTVSAFQATLTDTYTVYPSGAFCWEAVIPVTKQVLNREGKETPVTASFYVMLYQDQNHTQPALQAPAEILLEEASSGQTEVLLKMTEASGTYYAAETDEQGNLQKSGDKAFGYHIRFAEGTTGAVEISLGEKSSLTVINQQCTDTVARLRVTDPSGRLLSGASMVVKDAKGKVLDLNGTALTFTSGSKDYVLTNQLPAGTYYLSQITAPSGYHASPDVEFTVRDGQTTEAVLVSQPVRKTDTGRITVYKQVYSGEHQVYAQDTSAGKYAAQGRYTFYAALFSDKALTKKVSDVKTITVSGDSGNTVFRNLKPGETYYIGETDQYGQTLSSENSRQITYTSSGRIHLGSGNEASGQVIIRNIYKTLPAGYRYTAKLTVRKYVQDSSGADLAVSDTFYIGIFRKSDYSDTPTIVPVTLENASSGSVSRRILLAGNSDVTYYFAEVDAQGNLVSGQDTFGYEVFMDPSSLTITKGAQAEIAVTNTEKSSKVTLYLTKRVFEGAEPLQVSDTFYAGLFKDKEFTQLYADPIPLTLEESSAVTLKLSLSLGSAKNAEIYVAEVDENGNLVHSSEEFGYDVRMMNARAAFDQDTKEVQTVLINSVYGTSTEDDWSSIYSMAGEGLNSSYVSENGALPEAAQTGDVTPLPWYLGLLLLSGGGLWTGIRFRRKKY